MTKYFAINEGVPTLSAYEAFELQQNLGTTQMDDVLENRELQPRWRCFDDHCTKYFQKQFLDN